MKRPLIRFVALGLAAWSLAGGAPATAEIFSSKNKSAIFGAQKRLLDSRGASQYNFSTRLQPPTIHQDARYGAPAYAGQYRGKYLDMAKAAARKHGVPENLFARLVHQESRWNPRARSHKGAMGLAQLMPGTAADLGVDPWNPRENLDGGARYLAQQYREFGSWRLALAAYNAGPQAVKKHGGIPPFKETRDYVRIVWGS